MSPKVLVVDDEPGIVEMIRRFLVKDGFSVSVAYDGVSALEAFDREEPDIVVLDVMLPKMNGMEVLKRLRETSQVPVLLLTARSLEEDKISGLILGADDYLTKPFSLRELTLRLRAIMRRTSAALPPKPIVFGDLTLDPEKMEVHVGGRQITLTRAEFQVLSALYSRPGKVFTREELLNVVAGDIYESYERTIDTHVWSLRKKIEPDPSKPKYVLTVFGVGYKSGNAP